MAGSGVNVKLGVSGVAQFKQSISQAKQNLKTLDAQLSLTEKQFKASGDAETYMQQKTEQLKAKLEEQKAVAAAAQKALEDMTSRGVDKGSKAFQDMIRTLATAKGDIIDTEQALNNVSDSGGNAADGVSEMNSQLKKVGQGISWQNVTSGIESITGKLERAGKAAFQMGQRLVNATLGKGQWADELRTTAKVLGIDEDTLQRMQKTSQIIDTSVEAITGAQKKLRKGIGSADQGVMGAFAEILGEGYDPKQKGWEDAFWDAGEAIMKFADEEQKEVYAQKLFGRSWNELIPLFEAGRKEYEETNASWNTISKEQLDSLTAMDDQYQRLTAAWEDFQTQILAAFSGPLTQGMETITALFNELNEYLQTPEGQAALEQMGATVTKLIEDLVNVDPEEVIGGLKSVIDGITGAFEWIQTNKDGVVAAITAIAGAFALLNVTSFALKVGQLVSGFKGLLGGGGNPTGTPVTGTGGGNGTFITGAMNWMTKAGTEAAGAFASTGQFFPVLFDWITHNTKVGHLLMGTETVDSIKEEIGQNKSTFAEDWRNNVLTKWMFDLGENSIRFWDGFWDNVFNGGGMNENAPVGWSPGGGIYNNPNMPSIEDAVDKMEEAVDAITGSSSQDNGNSETAQAVKGLKGMPGEVGRAVAASLSGVTVQMDGATVGALLLPYISGGMGQGVMSMLIQ